MAMRPPPLQPFLSAIAIVAGLVLSPGPLGDAEAMAEAVPVPRLDPRRPQDDPIAALIGSGPGASAPAITSAAAAPASPDDDIALSAFAVAADLLRKGDPAAATAAAYALSDRASVDLIDWLIATRGADEVPASRIAQIMDRLKGWPGQSLMQLRLEQALDSEDASDAAIRSALGGRAPETDKAMIAVGRALMAAGETTAAARLIRDRWRRRNFESRVENEIAETFAGLLRPEDHKARMDRQLYDNESAEALRTAGRLGADQKKLADAVAATIRGRAAADGLLAGLPASVTNDPVAVYSRVQRLRRAGDYTAAASLLAKAPTDQGALVDPDAWTRERRIIGRDLSEEGKASAAYAVIAGHSARSAGAIADAEFEAGWLALEHLGQPDRAIPHFQRIANIASRPLSLSRAEYWLGRAHKAAGRADAASAHLNRAAGYTTTFYGQLAHEETGRADLPVYRAPAANRAVIETFNDRLYVQVIRRLIKANLADRSSVFFRQLADTLTSSAEMRLLVELAHDADLDAVALQIGIVASGRGLSVDDLAFPTHAIPANVDTGGTERALVYAISRQESRFNREAVSSAGARGLMQLMPATARETARAIGLRYSRARLTEDPAYNARLGAAYLERMGARFGGSYILTAVAYNAGGSRAVEWIERFGDPRDPDVDVVNWIESIPFSETRNYVQRVMENLQVYQALLGNESFSIVEDLRRGTTG